jgi:2-polyprenyl-3-methyl-5-hydroxy-6-metoxy-1,4-benzoquinol methylase
MSMRSEAYYQEYAAQFFDQTLGIDLSELRRKFTDLLPSGARILDAGCGSGRDAKAFAMQGFDVTAFDASQAMVELARWHTGLPVQRLTFQEFRADKPLHGIWACASLLHVPANEEQAVWRRLVDALADHGILYASYKLGEGERVDGGHSPQGHQPGYHPKDWTTRTSARVEAMRWLNLGRASSS